ncbi:MAG: hypothetical protein KatS3mg082_3374 [Nitrospiraceae bacterium]|nr:MAG: hypothetical protein KatS3mg051_1839 [Anaerolineae bacterium]GIW56970.1 MAG: hypothetical protein KatS3mg082_3374 [Nitrospiraceae bacterium]
MPVLTEEQLLRSTTAAAMLEEARRLLQQHNLVLVHVHPPTDTLGLRYRVRPPNHKGGRYIDADYQYELYSMVEGIARLTDTVVLPLATDNYALWRR